MEASFVWHGLIILSIHMMIPLPGIALPLLSFLDLELLVLALLLNDGIAERCLQQSGWMSGGYVMSIVCCC